MGGIVKAITGKTPKPPKVTQTTAQKEAQATQVRSVENAEESLAFQREQTAAATKKAEAEKRESGEAYAAKSKALRRGGKRTLLSDKRLNPEMGIDDDEYKKTLG
tara:strand:- start:6780 stop:7094 length:315 start_codon:yes stop_codon:yes gene_type:complete